MRTLKPPSDELHHLQHKINQVVPMFFAVSCIFKFPKFIFFPANKMQFLISAEFHLQHALLGMHHLCLNIFACGTSSEQLELS